MHPVFSESKSVVSHIDSQVYTYNLSSFCSKAAIMSCIQCLPDTQTISTSVHHHPTSLYFFHANRAPPTHATLLQYIAALELWVLSSLYSSKSVTSHVPLSSSDWAVQVAGPVPTDFDLPVGYRPGTSQLPLNSSRNTKWCPWIVG